MTSPIACPRCNAINQPGARFCSLCSAPLQPSPLPQTPLQPQAASVVRHDSNEVLALCLAIFALCGCGPITAIPALIMARRQRAAKPYAQIPIATYWMSIIALGFTALTIVAMVLVIGFGAVSG
jgi:hypothetical protein